MKYVNENLSLNVCLNHLGRGLYIGCRWLFEGVRLATWRAMNQHLGSCPRAAVRTIATVGSELAGLTRAGGYNRLQLHPPRGASTGHIACCVSPYPFAATSPDRTEASVRARGVAAPGPCASNPIDPWARDIEPPSSQNNKGSSMHVRSAKCAYEVPVAMCTCSDLDSDGATHHPRSGFGLTIKVNTKVY